MAPSPQGSQRGRGNGHEPYHKRGRTASDKGSEQWRLESDSDSEIRAGKLACQGLGRRGAHLWAAVLLVFTARGLDHRAASPLEAHVEDRCQAAAGRRGGALGGVVALDGFGVGTGARPGRGRGARVRARLGAGIGRVGSGLCWVRRSHGDATETLLGLDHGLHLDVTLRICST